MKKLIGINGLKGSGKDLVCKMIQQQLPDMNYENKKFAGKLKEMATVLTGITDWEDRDKRDELIPWLDMTRRKFLQKFGTEAMRDNIHSEVWVNALMSQYKVRKRISMFGPHKIGYPKWIVTDVRFRNEAEAIKNAGGIVINIDRNLPQEDLHASETALLGYDFDFIIPNFGGKGQLLAKVKEFINYYS